MFRTKLAVLVCVALLSGCTRAVAPLPDVPRPAPTPPPPIVFPRDAGPHDALTEWWYYTGHLSDAAGHRYGFEFTIFQLERQSAPTGYVAHFAVSDITDGTFSHQARFTTVAQPVAGFPIDVNGWTLGGTDVIDATMDTAPWSLHLDLAGEKPPALHNGGYIDLGADGGSYYYSRTRLSASGTLNGSQVTGTAWMDHQWGNFLITQGLAWDWYSIQLDDQTELMLYVLRGSGQVYGTYIHPDGSLEALRSVQVEANGSWTSPHTGATYPSGWQVLLPDGRALRLQPQLADQELYFPGQPGVPYWEGAVDVSGDASGQGYVELTGYAPVR
ncbi:MAG: carotenoid 1,2-hydratase [Chloroflexi bacterium]|nr:carotenoid 1,2-hydratase [Chloroflexota bacterium]